MTSSRGSGLRRQARKRTRRWGEGGSFSSMLLTVSLLLLVTALGFLFGRVVIAKAYVRATGNLPKASEAAAPGGAPLAASQSAPESSSQGDASSADSDGSAPDSSADSGEAPSDQSDQTAASDGADASSTDESSTESADGSRDVRYAVQVGAFSGEQSARRAQSELTNVGYPARIVRERQGTQSSYKVLAGHYRTRDDADAALTDVKREGFSEAFVVEER